MDRQEQLAVALDDLISERGVSLDDHRLEFLAKFVQEREKAARDEGYNDGYNDGWAERSETVVD